MRAHREVNNSAPRLTVASFAWGAIAWLSASSAGFSQEHATVSGKVFDIVSKVPIPSATVMIRGTALGNSTDSSGIYEIGHIPPDLYIVEVRHIAYRSSLFPIHLAPGQKMILNFGLEQGIFKLEEVTVTSERERTRKLHQAYGSSVVSHEQIKTMGVVTLSELIHSLDPGSISRGIRKSLDRPPYLIYLDGQYVQYIPGSLDAIVEISQIDHIEISRWVGTGSNIGPGSSDKVIFIYTKRGR